MGFPCASAGRESAHSVGDLGSVPGLGRSLGEGKGYPLHHSGLENTMGCTVHEVKKSQTQLSNFHFHLANTIVISAPEERFTASTAKFCRTHPYNRQNVDSHVPHRSTKSEYLGVGRSAYLIRFPSVSSI